MAGIDSPKKIMERALDLDVQENILQARYLSFRVLFHLSLFGSLCVHTY